MGRVLTVALREFLETVKTKTFVFTTVLMPLLMVGMIFGAEALAKASSEEEVRTRPVGIIDQSRAVLPFLQREMDAHNQRHPNQLFVLRTDVPEDPAAQRRAVEANEYYAVLLIPSDALEAAEATIQIVRKDDQLQAIRRLDDILQAAFVSARCSATDPPLSVEQLRWLSRPVKATSIDAGTGKATSGDEMARFMTPFAFMFFLVMGTLNISQGLLTSLIEEKSSRVIEVLLSAVSPTQLMAGKILGMVSVGGVLLSVWSIVGYASAEARDMEYLVTPYRLIHMALYFVPAFLLVSGMLAGIGSACNTLKDAQTLAFPLTLSTLVPMMLWWQITQFPQGWLAVVLSFIPPMTPYIMILRICADDQTPLWQVVATLTLLWASVFFTIWAAGRIFRVGVLLYGKAPTPRELLKWLRHA